VQYTWKKLEENLQQSEETINEPAKQQSNDF